MTNPGPNKRPYDFRRYYVDCPGCGRITWKGKFNRVSNRCDKCLGIEHQQSVLGKRNWFENGAGI